MKTTFYGRVSTDSDDQVNSLNNQISFFDDFIKENNYEGVDCGVLARRNGVFEALKGGYADEGISGKSLKKREAFKQMIRDAKLKKFDLIVTKSVARFGRSVEDTSKTVKDLKELGIGVFFLDLKINSLDNSKEFMINLFASLAQEESNNKSFIVQFGIRKAQAAGKFTGQAPYGYNIVDGYLQINEEEAAIVTKIYHHYYNEGFGTGKLARMLNGLGVPTKQGAKWSQIQVSRILDNPIYKGLQIQHVTQVIDINRDLRKVIPESEWIKHQIDSLIIIQPELFDLVQFEKQRRLEQFGHVSYIKNKYVDENGEVKIVTTRKMNRGDGRHSNTHIFSNILYCKNCGFALKRKKRKAYVRKDGTSRDLGYEWSCAQNDMYGKDKCKYRNNVIETDFIEYVKERIMEYRSNYDYDELFNVYVNKELSVDTSADNVADLEKRLEKLTRQSDLNFELLSEGNIAKEEYTHRNTRLQREITELRSELGKIKHIDDEIQSRRVQFNSFVKFLNEIDVENISNGLLRKIVSKIHVGTLSNIPSDALSDELFHGKVVSIEWTFMDKGYGELIG